MIVDYFSIIHRYISPESLTYRYYLPHVTLVTHKALEIARRLDLAPQQQQFIQEAAMLHDIGIVHVDAQDIGCTGSLPYLSHGTEGRIILEAEGLPQHALVCERHTGVGITKAEIELHHLPLPHRDMTPQSLEERIICYADVYYSKNPDRLWQSYTLDEIREWFARFGTQGMQKFEVFLRWRKEFDHRSETER